MKRIVIMFVLLFSFSAFARKPVVVSKGQKAPYSGILLDREHTAKILAEAEHRRRVAETEKQQAIERERLEAEKREKEIIARHKATVKILKIQLETTKAELAKARKLAIKGARNNSCWWKWGLAGVATGIAISATVGGVYVATR